MNFNKENSEDHNKFFDRKVIKQDLKFVDPNQNIEKYVLSLDVIDEYHPNFLRIVFLVKHYLRVCKYQMTDDDFKAIIDKEKNRRYL